MATKTPTTQSLRGLRAELARRYCESVLQSTATIELLEKEDGVHTDRLLYLAEEYADKFIAKFGAAS